MDFSNFFLQHLNTNMDVEHLNDGEVASIQQDLSYMTSFYKGRDEQQAIL